MRDTLPDDDVREGPVMEDSTHDPRLATPSGNPRARSLGIPFGGTPGPWNAITDVAGVEVGYATRIEGTNIRTGVTAVLPRGRDGIIDPCAAGFPLAERQR
jgi:hypothetical protein